MRLWLQLVIHNFGSGLLISRPRTTITATNNNNNNERILSILLILFHNLNSFVCWLVGFFGRIHLKFNVV